MTEGFSRPIRVGHNVDDLCRQCKTVRAHTVLALGEADEVRRVICDYCGSQHNFRGGEDRSRPEAHHTARRSDSRRASPSPLPLVSDRERSHPVMSQEESSLDLEMLFRRVLREESGLTPVAPAEKWRNGELVLRPGRQDQKETSWPIETFFHKIVMLRNRLRVLEQQINSSDLPEDSKIKLQGYLTACYGSLTSFNILFADEGDRFQGSGAKS